MWAIKKPQLDINWGFVTFKSQKLKVLQDNHLTTGSYVDFFTSNYQSPHHLDRIQRGDY
jgi:hypothetical protein